MANETSNAVTLNLSVTKCDQAETGMSVFLYTTNRSVCTVRSGFDYAAARRSKARQDLPFFRFKNGTFLIRQRFHTITQRLLHNFPKRRRYSTHSFRIGAATTATANFLPVSQPTFYPPSRQADAGNSTYRGYITLKQNTAHVKFCT